MGGTKRAAPSKPHTPMRQRRPGEPIEGGKPVPPAPRPRRPAPTSTHGHAWPASKVETWRRADIAPYERNARVHTTDQVGQIVRSIVEFGWTNPILVSEAGTVIAGHGRLMAAELMELAEVPVMIAVGWSDEQIRAYALADNQLTLNGSWNHDLLAFEVKGLEASGFDLGLTGLDSHQIDLALNGWSSDLDVKEHGSHTDGIDATIKVVVAQADKDRATKAIADALKAAGIETK